MRLYQIYSKEKPDPILASKYHSMLQEKLKKKKDRGQEQRTWRPRISPCKPKPDDGPPAGLPIWSRSTRPRSDFEKKLDATAEQSGKRDSDFHCVYARGWNLRCTAFSRVGSTCV